MFRHLAIAPVLLLAAACTAAGTGGGTGNGTVDLTGKLLPGTTGASAKAAIERHEALDSPDPGNGYAESFSYNPANDTFAVDNLGFDGANSYTRGNRVAGLGPFQVYEGPAIFPDTVTGTPIQQATHRAIRAQSATGNTELAIVRTGSYVAYGFGGFTYSRNGGVVLPTAGQAGFSGKYAGLRDFDGAGGLEYADGDMTMAIDFEDFNNGNAVQGNITNRRILDINGRDITASVIAAINTKLNANVSALPDLNFAVGPGVMDANGELVGDLSSFVATSSGVKVYESGKYYAILSGDLNTGGEVVGVFVVSGDDPRGTGVTGRETGGFLLSR